jgi:anaerobic selenocysteine-containing dehydrogenase
VRALVTIAGNPLSSAPNVKRLTDAVASLDVRVAIDPYLNETTRLADVVLPPPGPLDRAGYEIALYQLAIRNVAKFSPAAGPSGRPAEWEIVLTLAKGLMGMAAAPLAMADDFVAREVVKRELEGSGVAIEVDAAMAKLGARRGPERIVDLLLRLGPYGDRFGEARDGLTLDKLRDHPHGLDLGAMVPRLPDVLRTADRMIDLAPAMIVGDLTRLEASLDEAAPEMVLIGRRHLRSNNSWMHNLPALIKGPPRCTLLVHPDDAQRIGLTDGGAARVVSRAGEVTATVEITDAMMPGVVSLPHGFGHDQPGMRMRVAQEHAGANVNVLSDDARIDALSGNAAFNGVPVTIRAPA